MSLIDDFFNWSMGSGLNQADTTLNKAAKASPTANMSTVEDLNSKQFLKDNETRDLLAKQKSAQDLENRSSLAGSAYGSLGGANMQSFTNKSTGTKKSILGSF